MRTNCLDLQTLALQHGLTVRILLSVIAVLLTVVAAPADGRTLDEIIKDGTIRVGVNPNFPPMSSFGMTNELEGFDIDIGNKIGEALGVDVRFVTTETAQRVASRRPFWRRRPVV